jgi:DNA-binding MarR family transcriptional regulator
MQQSPSATDPLDVARCATGIVDAIPPVVWFMRCHMRVKRMGMSLAQFRTLVWIECHPDTSLSAVADHLGTSLSATSRTVTGLVKKSFLTRAEGGSDRRQLSLLITPAGRRVMNEAIEHTLSRFEERLKQLPPEQVAVLTQATDIFKSMFGSTGLAEQIRGGQPSRSAKTPVSKTPAARKGSAPKRAKGSGSAE